ANAILNGRFQASEEDLMVLKFIAPHDIDDFEKVNIILSEELRTPYKYLRELEDIAVSIKEVGNYIASFPSVNSRFVEYRLLEIYRDLESTRDRVLSMMRESSDEKVQKKAMEVVEQINDLLEKIKKKIEGR
ncbi:MAG: MoxR family ATPase, partial [Ignisphaera sp.]